MRTVFTNHMVAHVWAQQSQPSGRSNNGNFSFEGPHLYSYNTMIANFVTDKDGNKVPLFTSKTYSVTTTGKHQGPAHSAVNYKGFTVPSIGGRYSDSDAPDHAANLAYLEKEYADEVLRLRRRRDIYGSAQERLEQYAKPAVEYAERFGVKVLALDPVADAAAVLRFRVERDARLNTPANVEKRKREKERRRLREVADFRECKGKWPINSYMPYRVKDRARAVFTVDDFAARDARIAVINADKIGAWRRGEIGAYYTSYGQDGTLLRVRGDNIETSRGASFPVEHGKRAFPLIKACHDNKRPFVPNGHTIHLGHFTIAKIDEQGNVTAGCHFVTWVEIEQVAKQLGIADDPGNVITLCA